MICIAKRMVMEGTLRAHHTPPQLEGCTPLCNIQKGAQKLLWSPIILGLFLPAYVSKDIYHYVCNGIWMIIPCIPIYCSPPSPFCFLVNLTWRSPWWSRVWEQRQSESEPNPMQVHPGIHIQMWLVHGSFQALWGMRFCSFEGRRELFPPALAELYHPIPRIPHGILIVHYILMLSLSQDWN